MTAIKDVENRKSEFEINEESKYVKTYLFIKGYAVAKNFKQTIIALSLAKRLHEGQYRRGGDPYIIHPLKVCNTLISCGVENDTILAAALLHDVLEDCKDKLTMNGEEFITEYGLSPEVLEIITILTKESGLSEEELSVYFDKIKRNEKALLIKLSDRLHNSSTLYSFPYDKLVKYINETNKFIIPIADYRTDYYPEHTNAINLLKINIFSLNRSMSIMLEKSENQINILKEEIKELQEEIDQLKKLRD